MCQSFINLRDNQYAKCYTMPKIARRKSMTICIALRCVDGILLASDGKEMQIDQNGNILQVDDYGEKIFKYNNMGIMLSGNLASFYETRIELALSRCKTQNETIIEQIEQFLEFIKSQTSNKIDINLIDKLDKCEAELIFAGYNNDKQPFIYVTHTPSRVSLASLKVSRPYEIIGLSPIATYWLARLKFNNKWNIAQAKRLAVFVISESMRLFSYGVGLANKMAIITNEELHLLDHSEIEDLNREISNLNIGKPIIEFINSRI